MTELSIKARHTFIGYVPIKVKRLIGPDGSFHSVAAAVARVCLV